MGVNILDESFALSAAGPHTAYVYESQIAAKIISHFFKFGIIYSAVFFA